MEVKRFQEPDFYETKNREPYYRKVLLDIFRNTVITFLFQVCRSTLKWTRASDRDGALFRNDSGMLFGI